MIKSIIVDDEWYTLEDIKEMAEDTGFIEVCGTYENPLVALSECKKLMPQVAFVDIEMPEIDGLTLAERLLEINPSLQIVFITAYSQYAVQAFEINALDYVMKPVVRERFIKMAEKVRKTVRTEKTIAQNIHIQCFGGFNVKIDNTPVKWERAKAEELFAYLLTNRNKEIYKDVIIDNLWPEYEPAKALVILQTSVCRLRNIFSRCRDKVSLEYSGGKYSLEIKACDCDLFYTEDFLKSFLIENDCDYSGLEKVCDLIEQGYLSMNGYLWSYEKDEELKKQLCQILLNAAEYYRKNEDDRSAVRYLYKLVKAEPCEEEANIMLIKLLLKMNEREKAISHYMWLERILGEEYGLKPSKQIMQAII
ncbi:MAG: Transcriptional regulatory protein YehT [Firmicutes bacterium ADurb.Bin193]|nr:MAG: Transcriptional regulatory protein YehT [Firmicutes bacterium ADurb.Bin193]